MRSVLPMLACDSNLSVLYVNKHTDWCFILTYVRRLNVFFFNVYDLRCTPVGACMYDPCTAVCPIYFRLTFFGIRRIVRQGHHNRYHQGWTNEYEPPPCRWWRNKRCQLFRVQINNRHFFFSVLQQNNIVSYDLMEDTMAETVIIFNKTTNIWRMNVEPKNHWSKTIHQHRLRISKRHRLGTSISTSVKLNKFQYCNNHT